MIYRIAFASSDGKLVDTHFGHSRIFYIYTLDSDSGKAEFSRTEDVTPPCRGGEHEIPDFDAVADALGEISAVIVKRIGAGASMYLERRGIAVYQSPFLIDEILEKIIDERSWEADQWLSVTKS